MASLGRYGLMVDMTQLGSEHGYIITSRVHVITHPTPHPHPTPPTPPTPTATVNIFGPWNKLWSAFVTNNGTYTRELEALNVTVNCNTMQPYNEVTQYICLCSFYELLHNTPVYHPCDNILLTPLRRYCMETFVALSALWEGPVTDGCTSYRASDTELWSFLW